MIEKLTTNSAINEKLGKADLRDNRQVTKEMDLNLVSAVTVENLFLFIGVEPGEVTPAFDAKLNL